MPSSIGFGDFRYLVVSDEAVLQGLTTKVPIVIAGWKQWPFETPPPFQPVSYLVCLSLRIALK
jgi:hypothetical protein